MTSQLCFTDYLSGAPLDMGLFTFHDEDCFQTEYELFHLRQNSISLVDIPLKPFSACSSRKSSIDIVSFIPTQQVDTAIDSPSTVSSDTTFEVPSFQLTPSPLESVRIQLKEHRAQECKKRRQLRMSILKRKRQEGSISFDTKVRYKQRSEFAMTRARSCGRFAPGVQYSNVNI